jgi:hypothetical protein
MNGKRYVLSLFYLFSFLIISSLVTLGAKDFDIYHRDISNYKQLRIADDQDLLNHSSQTRGIIDFDQYVTYPTGSWPEVVAIGDVNNDNLNDVVIGTSFYFDSLNDYKIFVFAQNAAGELDPPVKYDGGDITSIDIDDLNNDILLDVVIGFGDSIGVFFQDISGVLQPKVAYHSGNDVDGVKIADFNNDNLMDIVSCHWNDSFIKVFTQEPYGIFDSTVTYSINQGGYDEIDAGDVTDDGLDDVIFMRGQLYANENIAIFEQDITGLLKLPVFYDLGNINTSGVAVGDVNSDAKKDVLVTHGGNQPSATVSVWLQDTSGTLIDPPTSYPCYDIPEPIEIADFDLDNRNDVVIANGGWIAVSVYQQNALGEFDPYVNFSIPYASHYQPQGLAVGDINNDTKPDIAIADYNNGLVILRNNSTVTGIKNPQRDAIERATFYLKKNLPNPFSQSVNIRFELRYTTYVYLKVYNAIGQEVARLVDETLPSGKHTRIFHSKGLQNGFYYIHLRVGEFSQIEKCLLIK